METDEVGEPDDEACKSGAAYARAASLGASPMGARVTPHLQHDQRYYGQNNSNANQTSRRTRLRDRIGLGALWGGDEE